ncbi:MAG TPA: tetratricopeptide repeat protein [Solimonas sp.]|nr:tetratricopeptide repeat protein [Solimonas sp.]
MKPVIFVLLAIGLASCASAPAKPGTSLFADAWFNPPEQPFRRADIFAISAPMQEFLTTRMAESLRHKGSRISLFEALQGELKLEFDSSMTRTAAQAFEARSGNCLSLVILTAAFAQELGVPVVYQDVSGYDTWSRAGGLAFLSGHVNLVLGTRRTGSLVEQGERSMTVDFLPQSAGTVRRTSVVSQDTIVAMYFNNRAAETLAAGDTNGAYWWARAAVEAAPAFLNSYNTLGVIYLRHGNFTDAERALGFALELEPGNARVMSNLVRALTALGRVAEAQQMQVRLAQLVEFPPFYFFEQGMAALQAGDNNVAIVQFGKELARMPYSHELHFFTALAELRLGEIRQARKHLVLALENSTTPDSRGIYAAKLEHLRALEVH